MKKLLLAMALIGGFASTPVYADFILNPTQVGQSGVVTFNGVVEGNVQPGLSASITYTLNSVNLASNLWTFGYSLTNTSSAPITASRVSTFGFSTDPNFDAANYLSGLVFTSVSSGNVPQHTAVEFCLTAGPNCAGGGGGGVALGASTTGSFSLDFAGIATNATQIDFSDLYVRYQSIVGSAFGDSGTGFPGPGVTPFCLTPPCGSVGVPGPVVGAGIPGIVAALGMLFGLQRYRRRRLA
jgi:hypothetical protein